MRLPRIAVEDQPAVEGRATADCQAGAGFFPSSRDSVGSALRYDPTVPLARMILARVLEKEELAKEEGQCDAAFASRRDILNSPGGAGWLPVGETRMAEYQIDVTEEAKADLDFYSAYERKIIVSEIRIQLSFEPLVETKNRKPLRENPIATWELRVGKYRLFYEVVDTARIVTVVSIGHKEHNALLVRGREVRL